MLPAAATNRIDDARKYAVAEKHNLAIVSVGPDFDRTDRGRKALADALA